MPLPPMNDTQYLDERCGLIFPWFTKPMLDVLTTWRLEDKRVFEYGGGHSSLWFAHHAKELYTVECDGKWIDGIYDEVRQRRGVISPVFPEGPLGYYHYEGSDFVGNILYRPVIPGEVELKSWYVNAIYEIEGEFDLIIVDGSYRDECIAAALTKIKDGGIIICDNWDQEGVWDSIMGSRLLNPWEAHLYVEPSRANDARPWKTGFWQIYKQEKKIWGGGRYIPNILWVDNEYESHKPMLWMALEHIKPGLVVELGSGYGSTPILERYCDLQGREFLSYETNPEWADRFPMITYYVPQDYHKILTQQLDLHSSILFIDCAPGEERAVYLKEYAAKYTVLIVHDTEPEAEYVYHLQDALNRFRYRCDLIIEGYPQTTAVSNVYDFERWKGVTLGKYKFI